MITVDTRGTTAYSPLIPAIKAMCCLLYTEQSIGFREIYDGEQLTVQFTIAKK